DQPEIHNVAAELGIDNLAQAGENHGLGKAIHFGLGTLAVPITKGFSLGLKRWLSITATLAKRVVTPEVSRTHPIRTPILLEPMMPTEVVPIPARKAQ